MARGGRTKQNGRRRLPPGTARRLKATRPGQRLMHGERFVIVSPTGAVFSGVLVGTMIPVSGQERWAIFRGVR